MYLSQLDPSLTNGDMATIFSVGGCFQGFSSLLGGVIIVPVLGVRRSLILACLVFTVSPLLTFFLLNQPVEVLILSYGVLSAVATNFILVVSFMLPVTWFPDRRGIVVGLVNSGFGLSPTVFSPLQSYLVNPENIEPVRNNSMEKVAYFEATEVLEAVPFCLLYLSAIYATVFTIGIILCQENTGNKKEKVDTDLKQRLGDSIQYLRTETLTNKDFYLLWFSRLFYLIVASNTLAHWKTFSFTKNTDDKVLVIYISTATVYF